MRLRSISKGECGAVMIVVAVALPVIAIMVSLAINVAHWYDYSRNLQLRADSAALAAGDAYGSICANPTNAAMDSIGKTAQLYAGPMSAASDVFYPYGTTPTDLQALGQVINPAAGSNGYFNIPNLKAGTAGHYHVILNSDRYWHTGDTSASLSFNMGSVCSANDGTTTGPMVDVRVTQDSLPLFMPFLRLNSTLNAHARVEAQGIGISNNLKPLGVRDPGATPCLTVTFTPTGGGTTQSFELTLDQNLSGANEVWDNGNGTNVTMPPAGSNFIVSVTEHSQGADHTCNTSSNPITYDKLLLINSYGTANVPDPGGFLDPDQDGATTGGGWTKVPAGAPTFSSVEDDAVRQPAAPVTNTDQMTNTSNDDPATPPGQAFGFPDTQTWKTGDTYTLWVYGNTSGSTRRGVKYYVSTNNGATFPTNGTIIDANKPNGWYSQTITITSQAQLNGLQIRLTNERVGGGNATSTGTATVDEIYVERTPQNTNPPTIVGDAGGGGVTLLTNNACAPDQYFSTSAGCGVQVCAIVQFTNGATSPGVSVNGAAMNPSANPNCATAIPGATAWLSNVINIAQLSGVHSMTLAWTEHVTGGVPGQTCNGGGNCSGTFGVEQQAFGACNGDSGTVACPADNSGPVVRAEIGEGLASTIGSFQGGSTHPLVVRIDLAGLADALPTDRCPNQCTLMRFGIGNTDGSVDCGTGNSTSAVRQAMLDGCPRFGDAACTNTPYCAPFTKSPDGSCNNLGGRATDFAVDCVNSNNNGATIPECVGALIQVGGRPVGAGDPCHFTGSTGCARNHWALGEPIVGGDPRIITTFIVYPGDLSGATGNTPIPIRIFASFYVTGWQDQGNGKTISCPNSGPQANEPAPAGASKAAIWGHWITYTEPDAGGNGKPCNFQAFGDCAVVLTR